VSEPSTDRVRAFIARHQLDAEVVSTPEGVPTVELAAAALGVDVEQIVKTLIFESPDGALAIAIACGTNRVDRQKLAAVTGMPSLRLASPERVFSATGYPAGGVAPVDLPAGVSVTIDERVTRHLAVYGGAGTDLHMVRIRTADLVRVNQAMVAAIVREPGP
jgi:prolyl-tRNA editing enzyme YbaK/EbsC (Cys-tRNA(Pro) deacylase)